MKNKKALLSAVFAAFLLAQPKVGSCSCCFSK